MVTDDTLTPTSGVGGRGIYPSSKCILTMHCELDCQCALRRCRHCYFNKIPASLDGYFHVWFYMEIKRIEIKIENLEYFFYNLEKA